MGVRGTALRLVGFCLALLVTAGCIRVPKYGEPPPESYEVRTHSLLVNGCRRMPDGLEGCGAQQEVRIGPRRGKRLGLQADAPPLRVLPVEAEFLEDPDDQILEDCQPLAIGALGERQGVGSRECLQEVRILRYVDLEARTGELSRCDALHEGMLQAGVCEVAIPVPELLRRHGLSLHRPSDPS